MDARQLAYLEALDIPVWRLRGDAAAVEAPPAGPRLELRLGPGSCATLFVCGDPDAAAGALASDIARVLPEPPVWAWADSGGDGVSLAAAVDQRLFTRVVVFGRDLAADLLGEPLPERVGSARVLVVAGLGRLAASPQERRELWRAICSVGLTAVR